MSYQNINIDDGIIRWADDVSGDDIDDGDSISSENEGLENNGGRDRKSGQDIWEDEVVWITLQLLPGAEELSEMIKQEQTKQILKHEHAKTTAVLLASYIGKHNVLKDILAIGGSVQTTDSKGRTPLHLAAYTGNIDCLKILIDHEASVNQLEGTQSVTALHCAANKGNLHCLKYLIKYGADINACLGKKSPLHYAVESAALECVKELLVFGANPNTLQVFSETPLHVASAIGSIEIIKLLLKHGSSVNVQSGNDKSTPLHLAAEDGNLETVRLLLDAGANISATNYKKQTPLHIAALCQATDTLELLLKRGAKPNQSDVDGRTPLHSAIVKVSRSCECVKLLLNSRANVNQPDLFGYTPLHLAALNEFSNCVLLLINHGGDVTARTNGGVSVLSFITRRTPDVIPKYIAKFDNSIKLADHEIGDVDCELKLDFRILVPSTVKGETELLLNFIEVGHREILKHPLCDTFLFLKWRRIRKFFLFSLFYHLLFVILYTFYTVGVFVRDCNSKLVFFRGGPPSQDCNISSTVRIIGHLLITLNLILITKELFQIAHNWLVYVKQWENWLQWLIIISVFCCVIPTNGDIRTILFRWQHDVAAIGIFLSWVELMMIVGRFPIFGLYIQMFTTVAINFTKFFFAYIWLLIAFSLSFGVLFSKYPAFNRWYLGIIKVIIMMSGELEFEDIFYDEDNYTIEYEGTTHIMFLAFVLLVTVILTNLMVGLAVSDIQGLQQSAGLDRLVRQAELVAHLESMLFSRLLTWLPRRILAFLFKQALLLKSQHRWALYIRPNDPREERIPKDLIKSIYDLVVNKKDVRRKKKSAECYSMPQSPVMRDNTRRISVGVRNSYAVQPESLYYFFPK